MKSPDIQHLTIKCALAFLAFTALVGVYAQSPIQEQIETIQVEKVGALTGPESPGAKLMKAVNVCKTDLGTMAELGGKIFFAFGDTFGFSGNRCVPGPGGPDWRSNVLGFTTDHDPSNGIVIEGWLTGPNGNAVAVTEGAHQPPFTGQNGEQSRIPTAMVAVGKRLYLHYMSVYGFAQKGGVWLCNYSRFVYSDDGGHSWTEAKHNVDGYGGTFNMLALTHQAGSGNEQGRYVYVLGTPCGRFGGARVARVPADKMLEPEAWEYYTGNGWSAEQNDAAEVIKPPVGEASILWDAGLKRWLYTYLNEDNDSLELRLAPNPWGPWSKPYTLTTAEHYPALYGAFMTPSFLKDNGRTLYFVMSQFGPYETYIMKATLDVR
jgi:hypothetical protein